MDCLWSAVKSSGTACASVFPCLRAERTTAAAAEELLRNEQTAFFSTRRVCTFAAAPSGPMCVPCTVEEVLGDGVLQIADGDHTHVRLLGLDTPPRVQPVALALYRRLCPKGGPVVVQYSPAEWPDRRGRLAYVFAPHPGGLGHVCVNLALLELGVAYVLASRTQPPLNLSSLRAAQLEARRARRNLWGLVNEDARVRVSADGNAFHRVGSGCALDGRELALREALDGTYAPCTACNTLEALLRAKPAPASAAVP